MFGNTCLIRFFQLQPLVCLIFIALVCTNQSKAQDFWANPVSGSWTQASNWLDGSIPTALDDVQFNVVGAPYTVTVGSADANSVSINSPDATVFVTSSGGQLNLNVSDDVEINLGRLVSNGAFQINSQNGIAINGGSLIPTNHSTLTVLNGVQNMPGGTINVRGVRNSLGTATFGAKLFSPAGLDNMGLIKLETNRGSNGGVLSILEVNGTLTNSGTIDSRPFEGFAAGLKSIVVDDLINSGTIINNDSTNLNFSKSGATYQNSGTMDSGTEEFRFQNIVLFENLAGGLLTGSDVQIDSDANLNAQFLNAGQIDLDGDLEFIEIVDLENNGSIHSESGAIAMNSSISTFTNNGSVSTGTDGAISFFAGSYVHRPGATISSPSLSITSSDIILDDGFTTDSAFVNLFNSSMTGMGSYQVQPGNETFVTFLNVANTVPWENSGLVALASTNTAIANFNGGFTNFPGSELRIRGIRNSTGSATFGAQLNVVGDFENEGTIAFETFRTGPNTFARLEIAGALENCGVIESRPFDGSGTSGRTLNVDAVNNSGEIVQNDIGTFNLGRPGADYVSTGSVRLNVGDVRFTNMNSFSNQGEIWVSDTSTLWLTGTSFTNEVSGSICAAGTLRTQSGLGSFVDNGLLCPGSSPGTLTILNFAYQQSTDGVLEMEIGGLTPGSEHDQLVLAVSPGTFNGTLRLVFLDGYTPLQGDSFDLITGNVTENFAAVEVIGLQPDFEFDLTVAGGSLTLTALNDGAALVLGDVNQDGLVNLLDIGPFVALLSENAYQAEADINQDGLVNLLDAVPFVDLLSNG